MIHKGQSCKKIDVSLRENQNRTFDEIGSKEISLCDLIACETGYIRDMFAMCNIILIY